MQRKSKVIIFSMLILVIALILITQNKNIKQYFSLNSLGAKEVVHEDLYEPFLDDTSTGEELITELTNSHNTDSEEGFMSNYLSYDLPDTLEDGNYSPLLGYLGGKLFRLKESGNSIAQEASNSADFGWNAYGGVEIFRGLMRTFDSNNLKWVSLPWNHSAYVNEPETLSGCDAPAVLMLVDHELYTAAENATAAQQSSRMWYVFFAKENSDLSYGIFLNAAYYTKDDMIALAKTTKFKEDGFGFEREKYIGFKDVNYNLGMDECSDKGYLVLDGIKIVENSNLMEEFIRGADSGDTMRLRFAHFYDGLGPTYGDLVYDKDGYCFFFDDEENFTKVPYKYLLVLKGKWGNPVQEFRRVVVSDNKDLTFDEVNKALVSSNMDYINSVGRFRIVLFDY